MSEYNIAIIYLDLNTLLFKQKTEVTEEKGIERIFFKKNRFLLYQLEWSWLIFSNKQPQYVIDLT